MLICSLGLPPYVDSPFRIYAFRARTKVSIKASKGKALSRRSNFHAPPHCPRADRKPQSQNDIIILYGFALYLQYDCLDAPLNIGNDSLAWWTDRNDKTHIYWAGDGLQHSHGCHCRYQVNIRPRISKILHLGYYLYF